MKRKIIGFALLICMVAFMVIPRVSAPPIQTVRIERSLSASVSNWGANYTAVSIAPTGLASYANDSYSVVSIGHLWDTDNSRFTIYRGFHRFDTTEIPKASDIISAYVEVAGSGKYEGRGFLIHLQKWTEGNDGVSVEDFDAFDNVNYDYGDFGYENFTNEYNNIHIRNFELIEKEGFTDICIRISTEIEVSEPLTQELIQIFISSSAPLYLVISYKIEKTSGGRPTPPPFGWRPWQIFSLQALLIVGFIGFFPLLITRLKKTSGAEVQHRKFKVIEKKLGRLRWKK